MPRSRTTVGLSLSQCHELGRLVVVRCNWCRGPARNYRPADMQRLLGDREVDALHGTLLCEGCGRRDYLVIDARHMEAGEFVGATVRRLVRVRIIRRPVWRDERM